MLYRAVALAYDIYEAFCLVCMVAFIALALPSILN